VTPEKLIGSLFTHLNDEGYNKEGWGFYLAYAPKHFGWWTLPGDVYARIAACTLLLLGFIMAFRPKPGPPEGWPPILMITAFLLLISPHYPWYYVLAIPFLTRSLYPPLLFVTLLASAIYIEIDYVWLTPYPRFKVLSAMYAGFIVLALTSWWMDRRRAADTAVN
jgi:alpha-1,6-mannosyltransferase